MNAKFKYLPAITLVVICSCSGIKTVPPVLDGGRHAKIKIRTEPTRARIYVDDHYIGMSPVKAKVWYSHSRSLNILAEPVRSAQRAQNLVLEFPPVPKSITIAMDYIQKTVWKEEPDSIQIPSPVTIDTQYVVQVDTQYVDKEIVTPMVILLPVLFFKFDERVLSDEELGKLDKVEDILNRYPEYSLIIHGYADESGEEDYNRKLSLKRAGKIYEYFIDRGYLPSRFKVIGHGERVSITETGYLLEYESHRTVEFQLIINE